MNCVIDKLEYERIVQRLKNYQFDNDRELLFADLFLVALKKMNKLSLPVHRVRQESPDFVFTFDNHQIGLEHTRATHPQYQELNSSIEKMDDDILWESDIFKPDKKISSSSLENQIVDEKVGLKGKGYMGYEAEEEFVKFVNISLQKKTKLLGKKHFKHYSQNFLVIEDDTPIKVRKRQRIVIEFLKSLNYWSSLESPKFDKVFIHLGRNFLVYEPENIQVIDIQKNRLT